MKKILTLFIVIVLIATIANGQGTQIRNLPAASSVNSGDMFPGDAFGGGTYKYTFSQLLGARTITCAPPLLCNGGSSMDLSADRTFSLSGPNVKTINVVCTGGSVADTAAKDAAMSTLCSSGVGGIIHFSNTCALSSAIVCDAANGVTSPIIVEGDGRRNTTISFSACAGGSGSDCILLASESAMGAGGTDGWGVRNLIIGGPSNKNLIHFKGLQGALLDNVYTSSGDISLVVEESRFGLLRNSYFFSPTTTAIKIIGETYSSQWFDSIEISTTGSTGSAVNYTKTGTTDAGGIYFHNVVVNGQWGGSGFLFSASTQHSMFINCDVCYADGNFAQDAFRVVKAGVVNLAQSYGTNQYPASNASALTLDNAINVHIDGGTYYTDTGAGGPAISLKNTTTFTTVSPSTHLWSIGYVAVKVDGTTHDVDLSPSFYSASSGFTNDATKIVPSSSVRFRSPMTLYTGTTKPSMFGMLSPAGTLAQYSAVDSSGVRKYYADNGSTVLETLSQTGAAVFTSTLSASNLSGTNTGDQVVPANTTATASQWFSAYNSSTGAFTKSQPAMSSLSDASTWQGWTDSGTTVNTTTSTDKVGIGTSSADSLLHITANAAALPAPIAGTLAHIGNADSTGATLTSDSFASTNTYACRRANTTNASPSALTANDVICNFAAYGYGTSAYGSTPGAAIRLTADQTWTNTAQGSRIDLLTADTNTTTPTAKWSISAMGHLTHTQTTAPTVACTGTGTSPSAPTVDSGGTDHKFTITVNTGTGSPGSTGTCTVTFATAFPAARPIVCMLVKGAAAWGNGATIQETTESASAPVFTWTNLVGGVATALTTSTSYKFSCITIG